MPNKLVQRGHPIFGTFFGAPKMLDIRGVHAPFAGVSLPSAITNFRIKSFVTFTFTIQNYCGFVEFFDAKIFGFAQVVFWNKETNRKYSYPIFMGPRRRFIPHSAEMGHCSTFKKSRYIRIGWDKKRDKISVIFNLHGDIVRPDVQGAILANYSAKNFCEITTVCPAHSKNRCVATYTVSSQIQGTLSLGKTRFSQESLMQKSQGSSLFWISRTFCNYENKFEHIFATGILDGKEISFRISMKDNEYCADEFNENLLFYEGECTLLPPVVITRPNAAIGTGYENKWIIQDTENMVDLIFESASSDTRIFSFLFARAKYDSFFGVLDGVLKTKEGNDLILKGFPAIAKKQFLRI